MKKFYLFLFALVGFTSLASASTIDDVAVCKHSYVLVMDQVTGTDASNKGAKPGKGSLFGDGFFLDVTGGSVANNKQQIDLSATDESGAYTWFDGKYAEYGNHYNSFRLKNAQDVIALKVTAGSKVIVLGQSHSGRYAIFNTQADMKGTTYGDGAVNSMQATYTAADDMTLYIGSQGGDYYISYVIVEANEAAGTPTIKVGAQTFGEGYWYKEVTCKTNAVEIEGEKFPTLCTYTTDGSTPDENSPVYTAPIKCYKDMEVKFQAYLDLGEGAAKDNICQDAENSGIVSFSFDMPTISNEGANVTITTPYEGATNYYATDGKTFQAGSSFTLSESATVTAYSQIVNGSYATFTTKSATKDVYVLNPVTEKLTLTATGVVKDSIDATTSNKVYYVENGAIDHNNLDFFIKNPSYAAISSADTLAKYQAPTGKEVYIQMSNTNITFQVAEGDSVDVTVTTSFNSCKNIWTANKEDGSVPAERQVYINVNGTNYGGADMADTSNPTRNIVKFGLPAGTYTFQKYSGTGAIYISSIEIKPASAGPEPVEPFEEEYVACTYDTETKKGVISTEFQAVVNENGVAQNVVDGQSHVKYSTAHMDFEAVGGATPMSHIKDGPFEGKGDSITVDPATGAVTVQAWNDIKWTNGQHGDTQFAYVAGTGNPYVGLSATIASEDYPECYKAVYEYYEPDGSKGLPKTGLYYRFTPKADGKLVARVWINKGNRKFYIIDEATGIALDTTQYSGEGYVNAQKNSDGTMRYMKYAHGVDPVLGEAGDTIGWKPNYLLTYCTYNEDGSVKQSGLANQPFFAWVTFNVEAGKSYLMFNHSSQLGFGGYKFSNSGSGLKGDADEDGTVTVTDITTIAAYILGQNPSPFNKDNADVDGDGDITVSDITGTASIILGK